ncbi:hypothetical protein [Alteribacter keqinensis]|nr:hypothetical protein [Alteribacter keqinensis]
MKKSRSELYIRHVLAPQYEFTRTHFLGYILEINLAYITMLWDKKLVG